MKCPTCLDGTAEYLPNEPPSTGYVLRACEGCRAGIYDDMSNAEYHAMTDWLGSTQLKGYLPEFYSEPTGRDALDFGTAFHTKVLGTNETIDVHDFATWRSKAAEEARAASDKAGTVPILKADADRIDGMVAAIKAHHKASALLWGLAGRNEVSIFANDDEGRQLKCRPDRLLDGGLVIDLKSTRSKPGRHWLARAVMDFGYDLSAAHYIETARNAGIDVTGFAFVFVGKDAPHHVTVVDLEPDFLDDGHALRDLALRRAATGAPTYEGAADFLTLSRPFRRDIPAA